ncbi:MAG: hypothetical protein KBA70_10485 [Aquabacterium sp.]|jgi:hypothetical protein|uniref:hypothetical protein n=1 Tax=Aquabacterium sp. TaxID=1872578 RepID=UPI001B3FEF02|nr:hypothetical protein [Aquabacterium sp.]MBP7133171.1 hypothetical protein [Aquabacterium sp.]MBP9062314.1 hypothetical protein [Aquabacterium sp.]MDQ5927130.1 hypothetical protein [Pseudomonadota bacterium]
MSKISYQRSSSKLVVAAVVAVAVIGAGAYWMTSGSSTAQQGGVVLSDSGLPGWPQASTGNPEPADITQPPVLADGRPSDVASDDWAALQAALAKVGVPAAEAGRIVSYNRYQRTFESWQNIDQADDAPRRRRVAQALMNQLPEHVSRGEFTLLEAVLIGSALIADIEPDTARRTARLDAWQAEVLTVLPIPSEDEAKAKAETRETELKRRQAQAFADWQALTDPAARTPARLEQALEEVRRAYNAMTF